MTRRRFQELFAGKLLLDIPSVPDHVIWKEGEERGDKLGCGRSIGSQNRLKTSTLSCRLQEENCENCIGFCFSGCSLREKKKITYDTERLIRLLCWFLILFLLNPSRSKKIKKFWKDWINYYTSRMNNYFSSIYHLLFLEAKIKVVEMPAGILIVFYYSWLPLRSTNFFIFKKYGRAKRR